MTSCDSCYSHHESAHGAKISISDSGLTTEYTEDVAGLSRPTAWKGRRVRALNSLGPDDGRLLLAISRGEFTMQGFRNQDLRPLLFDRPATRTTTEGRRQSSKVTRWLRLLRGHNLISKIAGTHRYRLTKTGRIQVTAILAAQNANTKKLTELAA